MEPSFCGTADRRILPVLIFWYCLHFCCCYGLNLRQCEQGWVQVPETSQSGADVLTCTGVPTSETVHWQFKSATGSRIVPFGTCLPLPGTCTSSLNTFTVSRPSTNVSHLTLSGNVSRTLAGATLYCYSGSTTANRVGCQADIVYPAEGVTCNFQLNFPTTVSGRCDISKIYSSQNRYNCTWLESDESSTQVIASKYVKWSTNQLSTNPILYSAICSLQGKPMPARRAIYAYRVKVSPGSISVNATFDGYSVDHTEPSDIETSSSMALCAGVGAAVGSVIAVVVIAVVVVILALVYWYRRHSCQVKPRQQGQEEDAQSDHGSETAHDTRNLIPTRESRPNPDQAGKAQESGNGNNPNPNLDVGKSKQATNTKQTGQAHSTEAETSAL